MPTHAMMASIKPRSPAVVCNRIKAGQVAPDLPPPKSLFGAEYRVVAPISGGAHANIPLLIVNEGSSDSPRWTELTGPFGKEDFTLTMNDFFDWNVRSWRDFRYVHGTN